MDAPRPDLLRHALSLVVIGLLIAGTLWTLLPFVGALVWATLLVVATWPLMRSLEQRLGGRRGWAVAVMTLGLVALVALPLGLAIATVVQHAGEIVEAVRALAQLRPEKIPEWLAQVPGIGAKLVEAWARLAEAGLAPLLKSAAPYAGRAATALAGQLGTLGMLGLQLLLMVGIAALLYAQGEVAARTLLRLGARLGGARGEAAVVLAGQAIRGVALGVGVTAIVQAVLGGLGLALAGVPFAGPLTALMLVLCIAQIGPVPVLVVAAAWLWWTGETGWALALLGWSAVVGTLDNVLRPALIRRGADLPLLLIFAGVIGGLIGFGLVGIFAGPVLLAVTYTLLKAWLAEEGPGEAAQGPGAGAQAQAQAQAQAPQAASAPPQAAP
ncbi:MAG: AI-2E family transporter YdiK, partial [Rubrivivax sp.]